MGQPGELEAVGAFFALLLYPFGMIIGIFILYHSNRTAKKIIDHFIITGKAWGDEDE